MDVRYFDENVKFFVASFEINTRSKIVRTIELLSEYEYRLGMPHSRMVETGLYELRIRGKPEVRLSYTFYQNKAVILLGYVKKTQKIPKPVMDLVRERKLQLTNI